MLAEPASRFPAPAGRRIPHIAYAMASLNSDEPSRIYCSRSRHDWCCSRGTTMSIGDDRFLAKEDMVAEASAAPRYCPRCDQAAEPLLTLCASCGERLVEQGYCLICERSWRLPVGAACPKHETTLSDRPPERETIAVAASRWVTVGRFV